MSESNCLLCQQDNACGLLQKNDNPCWCMAEDFTVDVKAALKRLDSHQACICQICVQRLRLAGEAS